MPLSAAALTCLGSPSFPFLDATPCKRRRGRRRDPSPTMAAPCLHLATSQSPSLTARPCQARRRRREKQEEEKDALPYGPGSPVKRRREGRRNGPPMPRRPKNRPRRKEEEEKKQRAAVPPPAQSTSRSYRAEPSRPAYPNRAGLPSRRPKPALDPSRPTKPARRPSRAVVGPLSRPAILLSPSTQATLSFSFVLNLADTRAPHVNVSCETDRWDLTDLDVDR